MTLIFSALWIYLKQTVARVQIFIRNKLINLLTLGLILTLAEFIQLRKCSPSLLPLERQRLSVQIFEKFLDSSSFHLRFCLLRSLLPFLGLFKRELHSIYSDGQICGDIKNIILYVIFVIINWISWSCNLNYTYIDSRTSIAVHR